MLAHLHTKHATLRTVVLAHHACIEADSAALL